MSDLRIRVELNKGRVGIPLPKLASIAEETMKFLSMLSDDIAVGGDPKNWIASNFENNSVDFDCTKNDVIDEAKRRVAIRACRAIMRNECDDATVSALIRPATRLQYSYIAKPIDPDEVVTFGLYHNGSSKPDESYVLSRSFAAQIAKDIPDAARYHGEIQGIVHALYKESERPKVVVRELSTRNLVDCFFKPQQYRGIVELLEDPTLVVFIEGNVRENLVTGDVESIEVECFHPAPKFDPVFFEQFIGSAPNMTGKLSTEKFVERFRSNG